MGIYSQVVSFEQTCKLEKLGFKRDCILYWSKSITESQFTPGYFRQGFGEQKPAYIAGELMQSLPATIMLKECESDSDDDARECYLGVNKTDRGYCAMYIESDEEFPRTFDTEVYGETLVSALCNMVIFLLENDLFPQKNE